MSMRQWFAVGILFIPAVGFAFDLGGALQAADAYFKADDARVLREQQREQFDWERQRAQSELERMRMQRELEQQRINNSRRQALEQEKSAAREKDAARATVQAAIDQNPKLKGWQTSDPARWARALEIDAVLRNLPENADLPLTERFAKVVRFVELEFQAKKAP